MPLVSTKRDSESAAYIVWVAGCIIPLLAIISLGLDGGRLFWAKRQLQTAVDATALSGARMLIMRPDQDLSTIKSLTDDLMEENLRRMNFMERDEIMADTSGSSHAICFGAGGACSSNPDDLPNDIKRRYIAASIVSRRDTLLMGSIPGLADEAVVSAASLVQNLKLQVVFVLDVSGSMDNSRSQIPDPPVGCEYPNNIRLCALKVAAKAFVDTMLPFDELGIATFSYRHQPHESVDMAGDFPDATQHNWGNGTDIIPGAVVANFRNDSTTLLPMTQIFDTDGNDQRDMIKDRIDSLDGDGWTNLASGIWRGGTIFQDAGPPPPNTKRVMIVISDGEPTEYLPLTLNWVGPHGDSSGYRPLNCADPEDRWIDSGTSSTLLERYRFLDAITHADDVLESGVLIYTIGLGFNPDPPATISNPFDEQVLLQRIANAQTRMKQESPMRPTWSNPDPVYHRRYGCVQNPAELVDQQEGQYLLAVKGTDLVDAFLQIANIRSMFTQ